MAESNKEQLIKVARQAYNQPGEAIQNVDVVGFMKQHVQDMALSLGNSVAMGGLSMKEARRKILALGLATRVVHDYSIQHMNELESSLGL
jgi:hypothetical protein